MKKRVIGVIFSICFVSRAWGGGVEGNGGNDVIQERVRQWLEIARIVHQDLETWAKPHFEEGLADRFEKAIEVTRFIDPVDHPLERKWEPVVEKNYPLPLGIALEEAPLYEEIRLPRIEFNFVIFDAMGILEKKGIVCHAYFGILKEEENHYLFSQRYKSLLIEREKIAEAFRTELRKHLGSMREGLHLLYSPPFEKLVQGLEEIETQSSYQLCTNQHHWKVWRYVTVSKQEQWKACFDLYAELKRYYWRVSDREKREILNARMKLFEEWGEEQSDDYRKEFLTHRKSELFSDIQGIESETRSLVQVRNENMRRGCGEIIDDEGETVGWQLPLDKTALCAVNYMKGLFSGEFPHLWETKRFQIRQFFEFQFDQSATFEDHSSL